MADPNTRRIVVKEQKEIHKGTNRNGHDYVIYQLVATTEGGVPIEQNLRSFQQLPKNQLIEVTVEKYTSQQSGAVSYTVSTKKKGGDTVGKRIDALERQVKDLTARLQAVEGRARAASSAPSTAAATAPPAASQQNQQQPPAVPVSSGPQMPSDDIPF